MFYEHIFRGLYAARVRYLIVGAVAINLHGVPRMTADLDLMLDLRQDNLRTFVETLTTLGYKPHVPVQAADLLDPSTRREWRETKSMVMFTFIHPARPYEEIDIFLENPIDFEAAYAGRTDSAIGDFTVSIAGISDRIALKRLAGREQDVSDIAALTRLLSLEARGES